MRRGILAGIDELKALGKKTGRAPFEKIYDTLAKRCGMILDAAPVTETHWQRMWERGRWGSAIAAARTAQGRIIDLLIAHHVDPNDAYRDRAVEELRNLVSWSRWVDPVDQDRSIDLCTAECAVAAVIALDWLGDDLPERERQEVIETIRARAIQPYRQAVADGAWWYSCYHHWNAVINSGVALTALALDDEDEDAADAHRLARRGLNNFFDALQREGGWDEGLGYWGYAMRYLLLLAEGEARLMDDQSLFHARGMEATGLFPIYFTPHGHAASFGDAPKPPLHGTLYLLAKYFDRPEVLWWLDTYAFTRDISAIDYSAAGLALLFRPADARTPQKPRLEPVKVFHEIGWAAIADQWPTPGMHLAAKTGDLAANHSQRDMNSLQLQIDGEMLLCDIGQSLHETELLGESGDEFYEVQARAHNTLTVGERDHRIDARGEILDAGSRDGYRWVVCDAGEACGDNVRFVRHVVMICRKKPSLGRLLVVLDELSNPAAEKIHQFWHIDGRVELDAKRGEGMIRGRRAALSFALRNTFEGAAELKDQTVRGDGADRFIQVAAPAVRQAKLLSVFSREPQKDSVELDVSDEGVRVLAGGAELRFRADRRRLRLASVKTG